MKKTTTRSIKDLRLTSSTILQKEDIILIKGGLKTEEQAAKWDSIKCQIAFKNAEKGNGDGLW